MHQSDGSQSDLCTIIIKLNAKSDLHIRSTVYHALEVLLGNSLFDPATATVVDTSGKPLTLADLRRLTA